MGKSLTVKQVCEHYGITRTTLYNWMRSDKGFPRGAIGPKGRRFSVDSIERFDRRFGSTNEKRYARKQVEA